MQLLKLKLKRNLENSFGIHHVTEYQIVSHYIDIYILYILS